MTHARLSPLFAAGLLAALVLTAPEIGLSQEPTGGTEAPVRQSTRDARPTIARQRRDASTVAKGSQGWWTGTVAMVAILGAAGVLCIAAKRQAEAANGGRLRVVGRVALPPKHAVFLVKAGGRTLLIGAGPQGAPSLLGELDDDEESPAPAVSSQSASVAARSPRPARAGQRFDALLGDES